MSIKVGDTIPAVTLKQLTDQGMMDVNTEVFFKGRKIVLFAVPGAFTPTCSAKHLPGYIEHAESFKQKGIDLACTAVNDPFVMNAWAKHNAVDNRIIMLPDGNGQLAHALGLEMDGSAYGLGTRSQRYALLVDDGVVKVLNVEKAGAFDVSSAEAMLKLV